MDNRKSSTNSLAFSQEVVFVTPSGRNVNPGAGEPGRTAFPVILELEESVGVLSHADITDLKW